MKHPFVLTLLSFTIFLIIVSGCGAGDRPTSEQATTATTVPTQTATATPAPPTETPAPTPTVQASQGDSLIATTEDEGDSIPPAQESGNDDAGSEILPVPNQPFDLTHSDGTTLIESSDQILSLDLTPGAVATDRIEKSATVQVLVNPSVDLAQVNGRCESNLINALPLILDLSWDEAAKGWEYNMSIAAVDEQGQPVAWLAAAPDEPDPDVTRSYDNPYCNQWASQELSAESGFTVKYPAPHKLWLGGSAGQPVTVTFNIRAKREESSPEQTATEAPASPEAALLAEIPLLDDAQNRRYLDELNSMDYQTLASAEAVVQFYQDKLPPLGWTYDGPGYAPDQEYYSFERDGADLLLQVYEFEGERTVSISVSIVATLAEASAAAEMVFPDDVEMQDSFLDEKTNDMRGEFLTGLSAAELVEFYGQAYPPAEGWRLIRPEPSSAEVEAGSFGAFFLQSETREIAFNLEAAAEEASLKVKFSTGPLADYAEANLPPDIEPLAALIGDAKGANVVSMDNMTTVLFSSRKPVAEIIELYRASLPGLGWQIVAEDQTSNRMTLIIEKAEQQWRLMIGAEFSSTGITLIQSK